MVKLSKWISEFKPILMVKWSILSPGGLKRHPPPVVERVQVASQQLDAPGDPLRLKLSENMVVCHGGFWVLFWLVALMVVCDGCSSWYRFMMFYVVLFQPTEWYGGKKKRAFEWQHGFKETVPFWPFGSYAATSCCYPQRPSTGKLIFQQIPRACHGLDGPFPSSFTFFILTS